jgi:hypothetical protein
MLLSALTVYRQDTGYPYVAKITTTNDHKLISLYLITNTTPFFSWASSLNTLPSHDTYSTLSLIVSHNLPSSNETQRPSTNHPTMNYSLQWSLLFLALAPAVSSFAFSGTAPDRLQPFVASGRRSIQQPQQSRSAASTKLFMSEYSSFYDYDDTEEVPPRESDSPSSGSSINKSSFDLSRSSPSTNKSKKDDKQQSRFLQGDDLHQLRKQVLDFQQDLREASRTQDTIAVEKLERAIVQAQQVDAEFMYTVATERMQAAAAAAQHDEADKYRKQAAEAREALPQFNLEGLWVGKYGEQGFEMINVTYVGDTLTAYKVTGDRNVPKGQASFTVDLSPNSEQYSSTSQKDKILEPIELATDAAEQWGSKFLQRFSGNGHVASEGFANSQWIDGQLILVGEYFSFAWLPIGHQVFFGRPSPELTLKLLREKGMFNGSRTGGSTDDKEREHLFRCLEETELLDDEMEVSDGVFSSHNQDDYYSQDGCFE